MGTFTLNWMNSKFKQFKKSYNNVGFRKFIKHALYVRHEELLNAGYLDKQKVFSFKNSLQIVPIGKKDQDVLFEFHRKSKSCELYPKNRIDRYFASDCKCFIALRNNKFVGHMWWGNKKMSFKYCDPALRYVGETFELKDDDVLAVDFFIIPAERGSGTALEFLSKVWLALNTLGYNRCFGLVQPQNRAARWIYKLFGFTDLQRIAVHRIFNYFVLNNKKFYLSPHSLSS